jgi:soluble lytic murein transglycosylase-like protein
MSALLQVIAFRLETRRLRPRIAQSRPLRALRPLGAVIPFAATQLAAAPAFADVIELGDKGAIRVVASDVGAAPERAADDSVLDIQLPDEAVTPASGTTAPTIYADAVRQVAEMNDVSPALLEALVWQESRWRAGARSHAGAIGLTQLMPGTARELGVNPHDVNANLFGGARYLRQQLDRFNGDIELALAAYNAGPGRVLRSRSIPNIAETQNYVRSVVDRLSQNHFEQGAKR